MPRVLGRIRKTPRRALLAVGMLLLALASVGAGARVASAASTDGRPPGGDLTNPVVRAVDVATPAVVRIATIYTGHITLTFCKQSVTLPASGDGYTLGGLGSGAFVSARGDILTADHVAHIAKDELDAEIFQGKRSSQDIADALNRSGCVSGRVTATDVQNGEVQYLGIAYTTSYSQPQILVWWSTAYSGEIAGGSKNATSYLDGLSPARHFQATVTSASSFAQNDLALLHVDATDTPSITLDVSADVAAQDTLTIIGFPGNADYQFDANDLLTPSINQVRVSAIKSNTNGEKLIQVSGAVEHGDSGGPALDAQGHIVGVVSFGGVDAPELTSFLRSSDTARAMLRSAGVDTQAGALQTLWQRAFGDYAASATGHWRKAAQELNDLQTRYPDFRGLESYRLYAGQAAQSEPLASLTQAPLPVVLIAGGALVVVVALLVSVGVALARRRGKARAALAGTPDVSVPTPGFPYGYAPYGYPSPQAPYPPLSSYPSPYPSQFAQQPATPHAQAYPAPVAIGAAYGRREVSAQETAPEQVSPQPASAWPARPEMGGALCVNGHSMPQGQSSCPYCGADRA